MTDFASLQLGFATSLEATDAILRALSKAANPEDLARLMEAISAELGFRHYALIHHDDLRGSRTDRVKLINYPSAIADRIIDQGTWRRDPIIRGCLFAPHAFLWSSLPSIMCMDRRDREALEMGRELGLNEGITVPCFTFRECSGSCTFAGMRVPERASRMVGMTQMIGSFAFQAAKRILIGPTSPLPPGPRLHPRPRDCVILVGKGKSNKAIARALGLTPRTVDGYIREAFQLFGVHSRVELVLAALYAGEIGLHEIWRGQPA